MPERGILSDFGTLPKLQNVPRHETMTTNTLQRRREILYWVESTWRVTLRDKLKYTDHVLLPQSISSRNSNSSSISRLRSSLSFKEEWFPTFQETSIQTLLRVRSRHSLWEFYSPIKSPNKLKS
ncbi:hypothetical protein V1477_008788 [Vespula maculifrons]|uniref:Uncharacterized protein n=1 Tax=Vespula maculifrons TaxID=7453 RepID=A0ABD2CEF9_VESMC